MRSISIVITTKSRTNLCGLCIDRISNHVKHDGFDAVYVISHDHSTSNHLDYIEKTLLKNGITSYEFVETPNDYSECNPAMLNYNVGVKRGLELSDYCLVSEDDWICERDLDITHFIDVMNSDESVLKIRLGWISRNEKTKPYNDEFNEVIDDTFRFVTQVGLVRRKTHDVLGYYKIGEGSLTERAIELIRTGEDIKCLIPKQFKIDSLDDESLFFTHAGKSEVGNRFPIPQRYLKYN